MEISSNRVRILCQSRISSPDGPRWGHTTRPLQSARPAPHRNTRSAYCWKRHSGSNKLLEEAESDGAVLCGLCKLSSPPGKRRKHRYKRSALVSQQVDRDGVA
ncbi:hypothetical protein IG631_03583 [Alternaria alternata]|nr:hypothetical protein IG631_03583 [Alternaria alternata]